MKKKKPGHLKPDPLPKCSSGIKGLDEISFGGLPKNRATLVTGSAGSGKTIMGLQFLMHGASKNEPGLFFSFQETENDLIKNASTVGYDLPDKIKKNQLVLKHIHIDRTQFDVSGKYNLDGLFIQIKYLINQYKIKRFVLDTVEVLFSHLMDEFFIRAELQRLFQWLKKKKVTAIVTAEQAHGSMTRFGLEEYVADCVIYLNNVVHSNLATRNLRIIKYRGSPHGSNEYPFIIDTHGITVLPITSLTLEYQVPKNYVSSGIKRLDQMIEGKGYYKGGSILISGTSGTGKSSIVSTFAESICKNGGTCIYFSFEESPSQLIRNMSSIGLNLRKYFKKKKLIFNAILPSAYDLESHLIMMMRIIDEINPDAVIIDPISNLKLIADPKKVRLMLSRLMNYTKNKKITLVMTSLLREGTVRSEEEISSMIDVWLQLKMFESDGERTIVIAVNKSRGLSHSRQLREVIFTNNGIDLTDVYLGSGKILTGSARIVQAMQDEVKELEKEEEQREKLLKLNDDKNAIESEMKKLKTKLQYLKDQENLIHTRIEKTKEVATKGVQKISIIRQPKSSPIRRRTR